MLQKNYPKILHLSLTISKNLYINLVSDLTGNINTQLINRICDNKPLIKAFKINLLRINTYTYKLKFLTQNNKLMFSSNKEYIDFKEPAVIVTESVNVTEVNSVSSQNKPGYYSYLPITVSGTSKRVYIAHYMFFGKRLNGAIYLPGKQPMSVYNDVFGNASPQVIKNGCILVDSMKSPVLESWKVIRITNLVQQRFMTDLLMEVLAQNMSNQVTYTVDLNHIKHLNNYSKGVHFNINFDKHMHKTFFTNSVFQTVLEGLVDANRVCGDNITEIELRNKVVDLNNLNGSTSCKLVPLVN